MDQLKVGKKYRLRANALSKLGFAPGEIITFLQKSGGGKQKDELLPVLYEFKKLDGSKWAWPRTSGELLNGYLEMIE